MMNFSFVIWYNLVLFKERVQRDWIEILQMKCLWFP
jgi:hypothetical protein